LGLLQAPEIVEISTADNTSTSGMPLFFGRDRGDLSARYHTTFIDGKTLPFRIYYHISWTAARWRSASREGQSDIII